MDILVQNPDDVNIESLKSKFDQLYSLALSKSGAWHRKIDEYEQDYFQEITGDATDCGNEEKFYSSDLTNIIDAAKNILANSGYQIAVDRPADLVLDKGKSGAMEEYLRSTYENLSHRSGEKLLMRLVDYTCRLSAGVLHWAYNINPIFGLEDYQPPLTLAPVEMWVVDPRRFFPILGGPLGQFEYVFHVEKRSLAQAVQLAQSLLADSPLALEQLSKVYGHYQSDRWHEVFDDLKNYWGWHYVNGRWTVVNAVMFGTAMLRAFTPMPAYTVFPWAMSPAIDTGHELYEKRWLPLTFSARPHVRQLEKIQGMMNTIMKKTANMPFVGEVSDNYHEPPIVTANPNEVIWLKPGQKLTPPPYQGLPRDLYPQFEMAQDRIMRSGFPPSVYGSSAAGSGFQGVQEQEGATLKLKEVSMSLEYALEQFFKGISYLVGMHKPQDVVYASYSHETAQPKKVILYGQDLMGWNIDVKWKVRFPGDALRKITMASQAKGTNLMSDDTIREELLGIENPKREADLILRDKAMMTHPAIMEAKVWEVLDEMGALPNLKVAEFVKLKMQVDQIVARGQASGEPPQMTQMKVQSFLQGIQMALDERQSKTQGGINPGQQPGGPPSQAGKSPEVPGRPPGRPPTTGERQLRDPSTGMQDQADAGQPPAGNPADPGAQLRRAANGMNPSNL